MKKSKISSFPARGSSANRLVPMAFALSVVLSAPVSHGFDIDTGNPDIAMRWDNTIKYSSAWRLKNPSNVLINTEANQDDGDRNFKKGLISNRFDLLSEFDVGYQKKYGFRASAAAWYDDIYQRSNDNTQTFPNNVPFGAGTIGPGTNNSSSVAGNQFNATAKRLHGNDIDGLDAFFYANGNLGEMPANVRIGRHSLIYGESLFFGNNGVAAGMAPMDIIKLLSVPGSQFKEIIRPVNQISGQVQLSDRVAVGAYYQFLWEKNRIPATGSYFSVADVFEGSESFLAFGPSPINSPFARKVDQRPSDSGQYGLQLKWRPESYDVELGFYASQYKDRNFQVFADLTPSLAFIGTGNPALYVPGNYGMLFPDQDVKVYGMSASGQIGDLNVSGEVSVRRDTPLVSDPYLNGAGVLAGAPIAVVIDNKSNATYAIGNSAHAQISAIALFSPSSWYNQATLLGEIAWNRRTSVTKNEFILAANSSRDAWAARMLFTPIWYQVHGLLDLSMPVGLGFSTHGNSSVVPQFNPGGKKGGDFSIGLQAVYQQAYKFGLTFNHFFGQEGVALSPLDGAGVATNAGGLGRGANLTFKQPMEDRDFVSFSFQYSF